MVVKFLLSSVPLCHVKKVLGCSLAFYIRNSLANFCMDQRTVLLLYF